MKKILVLASAVMLMFSSCKKEEFQPLPTEVADGAITASIAVEAENATRTYLEDNSLVPFWSKGDALGVFGADLNANSQFGLTAGAETAAGTFTGNTYYLVEGEPVFAYYPYTRGTKLTVVKNSTTGAITSAKVKLAISDYQTYLPKAKGTFDAAQAPAVGYIAELESTDEFNLSLTGVGSYLRIPVKGIGTLKNIEISAKGQQLSGEADVEIIANKPALNLSGTEGNITLACEGVVLNPYTETNLMVVVPAGTNINGEISIKATLSDNTEYTVTREAISTNNKVAANTIYTLSSVAGRGEYWVFGQNGKIVIKNAKEFLAYAYMVQDQDVNGLTYNADTKTFSGTATQPSVADYNFMLTQGMTPAVNETAWICAENNTIDMDALYAGYASAKDWAKAQYDALAAQKNALNAGLNAAQLAEIDFWMNVYNWYYTNNGHIESLKFNKVMGSGYGVDGIANNEKTTIKGLKVLGNGISAGASLENLVFENTTVKYTTDTYAGLVASSNQLYYTDGVGINHAMSVKNVVIGEGNTVSPKSSTDKVTYVGGIYGLFIPQTSILTSNYIPRASAISVSGAADAKVGKLYGLVNINPYTFNVASYEYDESNLPLIGQAAANIYALNATNVDKINSNVVGNVIVNPDGTSASVFVNGVSYWNGGYNMPDANTNEITAEELAYIIKNDTGAEIKLTNSIDMQGQYTKKVGNDYVPVFTVQVNGKESKSATTVDGNNLSISNVNIEGNVVGLECSLFGTVAHLSNLTVNNLNIKAIAKSNSVAGLARTGSATNVAVNNVSITVTGDEVHYSLWKPNYGVAAVFAYADANKLSNVKAANVTINSEAPVAAGIVVGVLELPGVEATINEVVVDGTNTVTVEGVGSMVLSATHDRTATKYANYDVKNAKLYAYKAPFGIAYLTDANWSTSGQSIFHLFTRDCNYGDKFAAGYWVKTLKSAKAEVLVGEAAANAKYLIKSETANAGSSAAYNMIGFNK